MTSKDKGLVKENKLPDSYVRVLEALKDRIRKTQLKSALSVNKHLIKLYWQIGRIIAERQRTEGWGKSVVERLACNLKNEFPDMSGFSPRNIWRMSSFYLAYTEDIQKLPQPVAEIPWGHNAVLLEKIDTPAPRACMEQEMDVSSGEEITGQPSGNEKE